MRVVWTPFLIRKELATEERKERREIPCACGRLAGSIATKPLRSLRLIIPEWLITDPRGSFKFSQKIGGFAENEGVGSRLLAAANNGALSGFALSGIEARCFI